VKNFHMKFTCIIFFTVFAILKSEAQSIVPELTSAWFQTIDHTGLSVSSSVGELAITYLQGTQSGISQGFHQGSMQITSIVQNDLPSAENWKVYPNPFNQSIFVESEIEPKNGRAYLYDLEGRLFGNYSLQGKTELLFSSIPSGTYILKLIDDSGKNASFKMLKPQ
jgi:hypothetical protein